MSELSESDEWEIPLEDYLYLNRKYNFEPILDVCATEENKQCDNYFNEKQNALNQIWDSKNWCNPPRKLYKEFVKYAHDEFKNYGHETMMIIPANSMCTKYSEKYILEIAEYYPIIGRMNFLHYGEDVGRSRNPYFVILWRKK